MRVEVDGVKYGVSFKHEAGRPGKMAREIVKKLSPPEAKIPDADLEQIAAVVQLVLDRHSSRRGTICPTCDGRVTGNTMPRPARRLREATTTCTIWKGEKRPWDDTTKALLPGAEENILISFTAECSINDHFNRKSGRKVAFMKALGPKGLNLGADDRKKWLTALKVAQKQIQKHSREVATKKLEAKALALAKESLASPTPNA